MKVFGLTWDISHQLTSGLRCSQPIPMIPSSAMEPLLQYTEYGFIRSIKVELHCEMPTCQKPTILIKVWPEYRIQIIANSYESVRHNISRLATSLTFTFTFTWYPHPQWSPSIRTLLWFYSLLIGQEPALVCSHWPSSISINLWSDRALWVLWETRAGNITGQSHVIVPVNGGSQSIRSKEIKDFHNRWCWIDFL